MQPTRKIILASSSKYRQELLARLRIDFDCISPSINEVPLSNEKPQELVKRLSMNKARKVAFDNPNAVVIGSDQIATFNNQIIGKPGNHQRAFRQLKSFSGQQIEFLTGVAVVIHSAKFEKYQLSKVAVKFKDLTDQQIENYLLIDKPYDCAGSFMVESLGVSLFDYVKSDDPTSLQGLPLISVCELLSDAEVSIIT